MQTQRSKLIQIIHVAKTRLGLDDDSYQALLANVANGETSCKAMTDAELKRVLLAMRQEGFTNTSSAAPKHDVKKCALPQAKKIRHLWLSLAAMGVLRDSSESALLSYVRRHTGIDRMEWCNATQLSSVIEALKLWIRRVEKEEINGSV